MRLLSVAGTATPETLSRQLILQIIIIKSLKLISMIGRCGRSEDWAFSTSTDLTTMLLVVGFVRAVEKRARSFDPVRIRIDRSNADDLPRKHTLGERMYVMPYQPH